MTNLNALADRVEEARGNDLALEVLVEVALFEPDRTYSAIRSNAAGTKVIYTRHDGSELTTWPLDWTFDREHTVACLRARATGGSHG